MGKFARQRDANEPEIIRVLKAAGASVQPLDGRGIPDLLVGFRGATFLLEVKQEHGKAGKNRKKTDDGLRDTQREWWGAWKGASPLVVTTPEEALRAIGAISPEGRLTV